MMPTKNRLVAVMTTLALAALSTSANATISTPFGSISAGGFSLNSPYPWNFGVGAAPASANQANAAGPSFGLWSPFFGLGQNDQQTLSVKTPFGGFYGPGFGLNPYGIGMGLGQQQALSVKTPFGGFYGPGFGVGGSFTGFGFEPFAPVFGVGHAGPGAGGYYTGFGSGAGAGSAPTFGYFFAPYWGLPAMQSSQWGLPQMQSPQIVPIAVPYPVPMQ